MEDIRRLNRKEIHLIEYLSSKGKYYLKNDWYQNTLVSHVDNGNMGSLYILDSKVNRSNRKFKEIISDCTFKDVDGGSVIASLYIDNNDQLLELDFWKLDFSHHNEISNVLDR